MNKKMIYTIVSIITLTLSFLLFSCQQYGRGSEKEEVKITNINIYKETPAWELALAVKDEKTDTIEKIAKDKPELLNYQDTRYGATLLFWAIGMEKYKSAEALLKCGANPNVLSKTEWKTPLFLAAGFSWIDNDAKKDPKYVKLLLSYGADPNITSSDSEKYIIEPDASPLMNSIGKGIEKTKALVEAGADINYKTERGYTAAIQALGMGANATLQGIEFSHYLISEKKAIVSEPYFRRQSYGNEDPNEPLFPVSRLRRWVYGLDSEAYKMKMDIVEEFARQGVDYWESEIPDDVIQQIKKLYPNDRQEYIKKY